MKTKAAILYKINTPLVLEEIEIPSLKPGQVLVRIAYSGVCHSQLNEIRGRKGDDKFLPHTLGHEGSGIILKIGSDVSKVKLGDHVVLTWIKGSGQDVPSCIYRKGDLIINSGAISTFATYSVVSENRIVPIPKEIPLDHAALLGCAIPTGGGIVRHTIKPSLGSNFAIFGVGGIGMAALLAASSLHCKPIIAVDIYDAKLILASRLGAHVTINAAREDPLVRIREITGGKGVDFALEAAGVREAMEMAFQAIRSNGGLLVIAGNLWSGEKISIDPFELIKGKHIIGSWGGDTDPDEDIPWYVDQYVQKKLTLSKLITHRFSLDQINHAIDVLEREGNVIRALIECESAMV